MTLPIRDDLERMLREVSLLEKELENHLNNADISQAQTEINEASLPQLDNYRKAIRTGRTIISKDSDDFDTPISSIKVIGVGGAGCNTASYLYELFKDNGIIEVYAVNTDVFQLKKSKADYKILIGKNICKGYGAGNNPEIGEAAMRESIEDLRELIANTDILFVTCGLGGGTGSGAAPVLIEAARELGVTTIAVCTLPFTSEGKKRFENARWALERIVESADTHIFVSNDKLIEIAPKISILQAFKLADSVLVTAIKALTDITLNDGAINVELSDALAVLRNGGSAVIGIGEADSSVENRGIAAVQKALTNPLLDVDVSTANKALLNISGDPSIGVDDVNKILEYINSKIGTDKEIIWGLFPNEALDDIIRVTVILTGIETVINDPFNGNSLELSKESEITPHIYLPSES